MGRSTRIDWADASWNPVTGCLHGCPYCYARGIAQRFGCKITGDIRESTSLVELDEPYISADGVTNPYPYEFIPTFHRYRLEIPQGWKTPKNIFVCSMADLCGEWVPEGWKQDVIAACKAAPQHRYLFLTKNPYGYNIWPSKDRKVEHQFDQENFWIGCSMTGTEDLSRYDYHYGRYLYAMGGNMIPGRAHRFISIEPILTDVIELIGYHGSALREEIASRYAGHFEWIIIGAETGTRKQKVIPKREWIIKIAEACEKAGKPVFMKESLRELMGNDFRQEFPWEVQA